jgi:hypothetical protein
MLDDFVSLTLSVEEMSAFVDDFVTVLALGQCKTSIVIAASRGRPQG